MDSDYFTNSVVSMSVKVTRNLITSERQKLLVINGRKAELFV